MFDHFTPPPTHDAGPLGTLLDVTLRDGGFEVDFHWPPALFAQLPATLAPLGVDIVELGYLGGVPLEHGVATPGVGAFLQPAQVEAAASYAPTPGQDGRVRLAAMVHPTALGGDLNLKAYTAAGLDMLRLVYHPDWFELITRFAGQARDHCLTVSVNIALASRYTRRELTEHAERVHAAMAPDVLYVADTCGALLPDQVTAVVTDLRQVSDTPVGFHAHDFLSLAYANALAAAAAGATYLDVSVLGLGRGGGNLQAELVLLRHRLRGRRIPPAALQGLMDCRARLASLAHQTTPSLLPAVCGALNLTPVEEQELAQFAAKEGIAASVAALWLACAAPRVTSLRADALRAAWRAETATGTGSTGPQSTEATRARPGEQPRRRGTGLPVHRLPGRGRRP